MTFVHSVKSQKSLEEINNYFHSFFFLSYFKFYIITYNIEKKTLIQ